MTKPILTMALKSWMIFIITMVCTTQASAMEHAAYYHALADLRAAYWLVNFQPDGKEQEWYEKAAATHINNIIGDIQKHNISDNKPLDDHSTITNSSRNRLVRMHNALDLLRKVRSNIKKNEDNNFGGNLQERILLEIDSAIGFIQRTINGK